jgi:hypothetical protein
MRRFVFDLDVMEKLDIPIDQFFLLCSMYFNNKVTSGTYQNAKIKDYYDITPILDSNGNKINTSFTINENGINMVESVFVNSEIQDKTKESKDRFEVLADKLRELYPKGKKPGTSYQWRDSTAIIAKKLKTVVKLYKTSFTDEEAVNATKRYIESFNGNYTYMQLLKYFISKKVIIDGSIEENSQLLSWIQNKEEGNIANWNDELV